MARKKSWFGWVRRLFVSEQKPKAEKKSKRWKWVLGGLNVKQWLALPAPQRTVSEASETQKKYALTVALATAAAADAAVAAAHAAAEVVRLTGASHPSRHFTKGVETLAAIKIQSAFRAYLARKALRALKGLVKLQAIVRGQVVRRQALIKMKHLPSNAKMRSEVQAKGITADGFCKSSENKHAVKSKKEVQEKETKVGEMILQLLKSKEVVEKEHKLVLNNQKSWNFSWRSKEDVEALLLKKQEANIKRERMMKYSFSNRERGNGLLEEPQLAEESGRQSHQINQWPNKETYNRERMENLKSAPISNFFTGDIFSPAQVKTRSTRKQDFIEGLNTPVSFPRRSFGSMRPNLAGDGNSLPNSPVFPTYMAPTQSAKLKARSMSTPKQREGFQDSCFE
ncbi:PREDICTED: protein IQ-DOMAIN 14-like isoform X2 [Populus euphratica]|uniref:Protein IQ-DOMAIN 14-like isoform X2 n=1 Tax=Populus euphratica TaxID=75702 RepID=A0AAJ6UNH8_POPEU|nr:PREDICTED: protein IQ-DOMAIN 14-like isoform X2 [Populus euphratica]